LQQGKLQQPRLWHEPSELQVADAVFASVPIEQQEGRSQQFVFNVNANATVNIAIEPMAMNLFFILIKLNLWKNV
jgi:hypothetical protein